MEARFSLPPFWLCSGRQKLLLFFVQVLCDLLASPRAERSTPRKVHRIGDFAKAAFGRWYSIFCRVWTRQRSTS